MAQIKRKEVTGIVETLLSKEVAGFKWDRASELHKFVTAALEMHESKREEKEVYQATEPCYDGTGDREVIGYFTGRPHDIAAYAECEEADVHKVEIKHIASGYANHKLNIEAKRKALLKQIALLDAQLAAKDFHRDED